MARAYNVPKVARGPNHDTNYGRKLNRRARALVHSAIERLTNGDWSGFKGTGKAGEHGRDFFDQLCYEIWANPLAAMQWLNAATPDDEGEGAPNQAAASVVTNIGALYLQAMQRAKPVETIEGTTLVQHVASDW